MPHVETSKYLHELSQRTYNILQIIKAHSTEPVEPDKELMRLYKLELDKFNDLLDHQLISKSFSRITLSPSLISNFQDTAKARSNIESAKDSLSKMLAKVESMRERSHASTGIDDEQLKSYLQEVSNRKSIVKSGSITKSQSSCEITNNGELIISGTKKDIKLTPTIASLLRKFCIKDESGDYKLVELSYLNRGIGKDAFRTNLARLRKATKPYLTFVSERTSTGKSAYRMYVNE